MTSSTGRDCQSSRGAQRWVGAAVIALAMSAGCEGTLDIEELGESTTASARYRTERWAKSLGANVLDGRLDERGWSAVFLASAAKVEIPGASATVTWGALWDDVYLYVGAVASDASLQSDSADKHWDDDSFEIYLNGNHRRGPSQVGFDRQLAVRYGDDVLHGIRALGLAEHAQHVGDGQWSAELRVRWSDLTSIGGAPQPGAVIGFDLGYNDDDDGEGRDGQLMWSGSRSNWESTVGFGVLELVSDSSPVNDGSAVSGSSPVNDTAPGKDQGPEPRPAFTVVDVGPGKRPGAGTFDSATGVYGLTSYGFDITGTADDFTFLHWNREGDATLSARVTGMQPSAACWSLAGLMMRDSTAPGSPHVMVAVSKQLNGAWYAHLQTRASANGPTTEARLPLGRPLGEQVAWLKLVRAGSSYAAFVSSDGVTYVALGSPQTLPMVGGLVGLVATSHDASASGAATKFFDQVAGP